MLEKLNHIDSQIEKAISILTDAQNQPLSHYEDQAVTILCDLLFDIHDMKIAHITTTPEFLDETLEELKRF